MTLHSLVRALGGTALVALAASAGDGRERVIARSFTSELELRSDSFTLHSASDGNEGDQDLPAYGRRETHLLECEDTLAGDDDPPTDFTRLYRTVNGTLEREGEKAPPEKSVTAGLEGKSVRFERDGDGKYTRTCDDTSVRKGQLERLRAELSLQVLLPGEDDGESWEIPFEKLARLLAPLGESRPRKGKDKPNDKKPAAPKNGLNFAPAFLSEPLEALFANGDGSVTATRQKDIDDEGLPRSATLEFRITSSFDGSKSLLVGQESDHEDTLDIVYHGKGTLAWNPATGKVKVALDGELELDENFSVQVERGKQTLDLKGKATCSGTLKVEGEEGSGE